MGKDYECPDCGDVLVYAPINQCWYECNCGYSIDEAIVDAECSEISEAKT
jgi:hypothetical protein